MKVQIDILVQSGAGRFKNVHSVTSDDASSFLQSGEVAVDDASIGELIHSTNFDTMNTFAIVNTGDNDMVAQINTDSAPASSVNNITLNPGDFALVPQPQYTTFKTIKLFELVSGSPTTARFWVSGS